MEFEAAHLFLALLVAILILMAGMGWTISYSAWAQRDVKRHTTEVMALSAQHTQDILRDMARWARQGKKDTDRMIQKMHNDTELLLQMILERTDRKE